MNIKQKATFSGHRGAIFALCVDTHNTYLYSAGDEGVVARWEIAHPEQAMGIIQTDTAIYALHLIESHNLLAVGTRDGTVYIVDLQTKATKITFRKFTESVFAFFYDTHTHCLWVLYGSGYVSVWNITEAVERITVRLSAHNLRSILPYGDNAMLIGASDGYVYQIHRQDFEVERRFLAHENSVFALAQKDNQLFTGGRDAHLNVWDAVTFHNLQKIPAHNFTLNDFAFSPDGKYLASASRDKTIKIWELPSVTLRKVIDFAKFQGHLHSVNRIIWLNEKHTFLSCSDDKRIICWEIEGE